MISENEITNNQDIPEVYKADLKILLERINVIRKAYGKPMSVTSGFRSYHDHERIYKEKAQKRGVPFYSSQVPKASKHLFCQAVDIADNDGELNKWCIKNEEFLRSVGIWCETRQGNWQHFQIKPFGSYKETGTIFFNP